MAVECNLVIPQGNQAVISLAVTLPPRGVEPAEPYDLTGFTLAFTVKPSAESADSAGTTYAPSVTSSAEGQATVTVPGSGNAAAGSFWYRLDVIDGSGNHVTAVYGTYEVLAV